MNEKLVSVVMPTYNHAHFLKESIDSVLGQTYRDLELIVVDNYSEDATQEVIKSYADPRIRYFQFRNEGIIAASRNYGIKQATGQYIAFIDSDDIWLPEKVNEQIKVMRGDQQIGISFCKFRAISPEKKDNGKIMGPKVAQLPDQIYDQLMKANFVVSSSTLVLKQALDEVGVFDENPELRCSEDFDLWLRLSRCYHAAYVNQVLGIYRMHESNQSANDLRLKRALAVIEKHQQKKWISSTQASYAKASFYLQVGWTLIDQNPKLARTHFREARQLSNRGVKISFVCLMGVLLTYVPRVYRYLRDHRIDKRISRRTINPQNL